MMREWRQELTSNKINKDSVLQKKIVPESQRERRKDINQNKSISPWSTLEKRKLRLEALANYEAASNSDKANKW